jgi:hypothetical protein
VGVTAAYEREPARKAEATSREREAALKVQARLLIGALIFIIMFIPIKRYGLPGGLPFDLEPYRMYVAILAFCWLLSLLADPAVRLRKTGLEASILMFGFAAIASDAVNPGRVQELSSNIVKSLLFLASFLIVFFVVVSLARTAGFVEAMIKFLVVCGSAIAVFALIEFRTSYNVFDHLNPLPLLEFKGGLSANELARSGRLRVYGPAQHPIALSAALAFLVPLAVGLAYARRQRRWWFAAGLLALGSLTAISRTAVLMLFGSTVVFLLLRRSHIVRLWPVLIVFVIVTYVALPNALGSLKGAFFPKGGLLAEQEQIVPQDPQFANGRLADIGPALSQVRAHPILGQGFGTRIVDGPNPNAALLDDQWLGTVLETGLVGLLALICLFVISIRRLVRDARQNHDAGGWLSVGFASALTGYALSMLTYDTFSFVQVAFLLFIVLALAAAHFMRDTAQADVPAAGHVHDPDGLIAPSAHARPQRA